MNEETNTHEPLAAIIAEMRAAAKSTDLFDGEAALVKAAKDARTVQAFQTGRDGVGLAEVRDVWCEMLIKCGTPIA